MVRSHLWAPSFPRRHTSMKSLPATVVGDSREVWRRGSIDTRNARSRRTTQEHAAQRVTFSETPFTGRSDDRECSSVRTCRRRRSTASIGRGTCGGARLGGGCQRWPDIGPARSESTRSESGKGAFERAELTVARGYDRPLRRPMTNSTPTPTNRPRIQEVRFPPRSSRRSGRRVSSAFDPKRTLAGNPAAMNTLLMQLRVSLPEHCRTVPLGQRTELLRTPGRSSTRSRGFGKHRSICGRHARIRHLELLHRHDQRQRQGVRGGESRDQGSPH